MTNLDNWQEEFDDIYSDPKNAYDCYECPGAVKSEVLIKYITTLLQAQRELVRDEMSNEFRTAHLTLDKAFDQGVEWGRKLQREENNELKWTLTPQKNETK